MNTENRGRVVSCYWADYYDDEDRIQQDSYEDEVMYRCIADEFDEFVDVWIEYCHQYD